MNTLNSKKHWENIYKTKDLKDLGWYQPIPKTSIDFLNQFNISQTAKIIDIGGGDSFFVDHLLNSGYKDVTVLDISISSLNRAKQRLGDKALKVKWIVADAATFKPTEKYDFWHDRAAFHFLTEEQDIANYIDIVQQNLKPGGVLVIGTFSEQGPDKCSGIKIKQYSELSMTGRLKKFFKKI